MALSHRMSIILGGAGTGKTSIIRAIKENSERKSIILCAPTGKASRNLAQRTNSSASTVHSLLGVNDSVSFMEAVPLSDTDMVIVDEASMLTTGMLAGLLKALPQNASLVLLGDSNQLSSVGAGDVIRDLIQIGIPWIQLTENHRQASTAKALNYNVCAFDAIRSVEGLHRDESFQLWKDDIDTLVRLASQMYSKCGSIQVLAATNADVRYLNSHIHAHVNPYAGDERCLREGDRIFVDGDRVMVLRNDTQHNVCNGDIGILRIHEDSSVTLDLPDGRCPGWGIGETSTVLGMLTHAYAITIHKSQGSEYDTLILYAHGVLNRSLLYTAISRARKRVILFGDSSSVERALRSTAPKRKTSLTERFHNTSLITKEVSQ